MAAGDAVQPPFDAAGQREIGRVDRQDDSRLEPMERLLQSHVLALARTATDRDQELVWPEAEEAGSSEALVGRLDDLAGSPDQHIGIPDGCHAVLGKTVHLDPDPTSLVEDRGNAPALGETEEGLAHQVALIAHADAVVSQTDEPIEARPPGPRGQG